MKTEILWREDNQFIDAGAMTSSVTEMQRMKQALDMNGISPKSILIVTCELHSRSERLLAGMIFPGAQIFLWANSAELEVEPDHPTKDQRTWPRWVWCSVLRYLALKAASKGWISLEWLSKHQHEPGDIN